MSLTSGIGLTPAYTISLGGTDITSNFADRLISLRFESFDGGGNADTIDISLDDRDWVIQAPSIGSGSATLDVAMGYVETGLYACGSFEVDEFTCELPVKTFRLHGNSIGFNSAVKAPVMISHVAQSLGDILGQIASSAGVSLAVDPSLSQVQMPKLNQFNSSMHLLQYLERELDGLAKFSDRYLSFTRRGTGLNASGNSIGTFLLGPEDLGSTTMRSSSRNSYSTTQASWWDPVAHQLRWLNSAVAGSPNSTVPFMIRNAYNSQAEAQAGADAQMRRLNRRDVEGTITLAKGYAGARGGQGFAIAGTRAGIDGSYLVRRAVHTLTKSEGLTTTLDVYTADEDTDFTPQSTDGSVVFPGIPATTLPSIGIGHM